MTPESANNVRNRRDRRSRSVDALKRLEYRGYDSAGVATLEGGISSAAAPRASSKTSKSGCKASRSPARSASATPAGRPTASRPRTTRIRTRPTRRVVHNGIIENFRELREELRRRARNSRPRPTPRSSRISSPRDEEGRSPGRGGAAALPRLRGAFALAFLFAGEDDLMIGARKGSPLAIGYGDGEMYLGSDAIALAPFTDTHQLSRGRRLGGADAQGRRDLRQDNRRGRERERQIRRVGVPGRQGQPPPLHGQGNPRAAEVVGHTLRITSTWRPSAVRCRSNCRSTSRIDPAHLDRRLRHRLLRRLVAKYWFERFARVPVEIDVASEFRYRERRCAGAGSRSSFRSRARPPTRWRRCATPRSRGSTSLVVVNVPTSTIAREARPVLPTLPAPRSASPRPRPSPASCGAGRARDRRRQGARRIVRRDESAKLVHALIEVPRLMAAALTTRAADRGDGARHRQIRDVLYLGRGTSYPMALEGALKLKEISYIHAEGYAAGELKHGPIALIDENMPVIVIAPYDRCSRRPSPTCRKSRRAAARSS
jgi:glucosamine--fructose-6-phosphate aminotransferase (isomerizing)